jgi:hypothetical protein
VTLTAVAIEDGMPANGTDRIVETNAGSNLNGAIFGDGDTELDYTEQTSWASDLSF